MSRNNDPDNNTPNMVCCIIFIIIMFATIPTLFYPLGVSLDSDNLNCYISEVEIPTVVPDINLDNWKVCDCGRHCLSYYPCIKLKSNLSDNYIRDSLYDSDDGCTFYEEHCLDTDNFTNLLEMSQNKYDEYFNKTINCYHNSVVSTTFLDNSIPYAELVAASIFIFFLCLACICINIDCCECLKNCMCDNILVRNIKLCFDNNFIINCIKSCINKIKNRNDKPKIIESNLDQIVIDTQPLNLYKLKKNEIKEQCVICLENYKKDKKVIQLNCGHIIHLKCWNQWKQQQSTCPVCRAVQL